MRFTIKAKLALSFGLILALFAAAGYFSITSLGGSNDRMQAFEARPFAQVQRVGELFKALKEVARNSYEITKFAKTQDSSFLEEYMKSLECVSYAIADYCTKPFQACNPDNDYIYKILCANGFPPILTPPNKA